MSGLELIFFVTRWHRYLRDMPTYKVLKGMALKETQHDREIEGAKQTDSHYFKLIFSDSLLVESEEMHCLRVAGAPKWW